MLKMKRKPLDQAGLIPLIIFILLVAVVVIVLAYLRVAHSSR